VEEEVVEVVRDEELGKLLRPRVRSKGSLWWFKPKVKVKHQL
jgi:hypothetical protein